MKRPISIKLDERLWVHIKDKPNRSRYIEELIKQDIHQAQIKPIVQSVSDELLSDEGFFNELSLRLNVTSFRSSTSSRSEASSKFSSPCCEEVELCKHWFYNEDEGNWKNELTRKVRDE